MIGASQRSTGKNSRVVVAIRSWGALAFALLVFGSAVHTRPAHAYSLIGTKWPQSQPGADVTLTYSYSNFLDGGLLNSQNQPVPTSLLRGSVEEALSLWASYAPLHFIEVPDSGPLPTSAESSYFDVGVPQLRIGHHPLDGFGNVKAHGYYPPSPGNPDQIVGDVHFDDQDRWDLVGSLTYPDILGAAVHELGHTLGLDHSSDTSAVMYPTFPRRAGLGTAFLTADDISGIQAIYGSGHGSVTPLSIPEPTGAILFTTAILGNFFSRRRNHNQ